MCIDTLFFFFECTTGGKNEWEVNSNVTNMNVNIPNDFLHALKKNKLLPQGLVLPGEKLY